MQLPKAFEEYTKQLMGDELYSTLRQGLEADIPVSIRLNPFKPARINPDVVKEEVAWCSNGYYLKDRPNFTFDPLLHAGVYYVQEAASMFLDHVLRQYITSPVSALDLCAAPGGKTTCARAALPTGSILIANEPISKRAQILAENVQKFGHNDVVVTNNYPKDFRKTSLLFDLIIADVPCSGEGMFRKDPQAIEEWSTENVEKCQRLQQSIIADIWQNLRPGGFLVYSTCTFNAHENEENVAWIARELGASLLPVKIDTNWKITGSLIGNPLDEADTNGSAFPVYRFIPGRTQSEGLFMCILQKNIDSSIDTNNATDNLLSAKHFEKELKALKVLAHGITPPEVKGKNIIPHISEALSIHVEEDKYPQTEVDYATAIAYLRHEAITLPPDTPHGIVLLIYKKHPIGFAKNLDNRANNLYPQEWRIKSTYIPDEPKTIK